MDNGPWNVEVTEEGVFVESEDFAHDVRPRIDGDFYGIEDKVAYARWLAAELSNKSPEQEKSRWMT